MQERDTPFDDPAARFDAGRFGMWLFLLVLGVLFAASILGYLVVRIDNGASFVPEGAPPPPKLLLLSTLALVISSLTMQGAVAAAKVGDPRQGGRMVATMLLAVAFLVLQGIAWAELIRKNIAITDGLYAWSFFVLTGLHAAHVLGGLPPMAITCWRAAKARYGPDNHRGIVYCAMYWHFLDGVWVVLYATLWLGSMR
jgi:cytochrome c oxidase subunit 3